MIKGPHQTAKPFCHQCRKGASDFNHCAWCGATLESTDQLSAHLDEGCAEQMMLAIAIEGLDR